MEHMAEEYATGIARIGYMRTLTPEEEKALREFFQKKKLSKMRRRLIKPVKRSKVSV